jgi:hypothetical protein
MSNAAVDKVVELSRKLGKLEGAAILLVSIIESAGMLELEGLKNFQRHEIARRIEKLERALEFVASKDMRAP